MAANREPIFIKAPVNAGTEITKDGPANGLLLTAGIEGTRVDRVTLVVTGALFEPTTVALRYGDGIGDRVFRYITMPIDLTSTKVLEGYNGGPLITLAPGKTLDIINVSSSSSIGNSGQIDVLVEAGNY